MGEEQQRPAKRKRFQCLFCLSSDPEKFESGGGSYGGVGGNWKILLRYLLETKDRRNEELMEDITKMREESREMKEEEGGSVAEWRECDECGVEAGRIGDLHRELELGQMKMVYRLKRFREKMGKQGHGGGNRGRSLGEIRAGGVLDVTGAEKGGMGKLGKVIQAFQGAVHEKGTESVDVPRVILDKFTYTHQGIQKEAGTSEEDGGVSGKREPEEEALAGGDTNFEEFPPDDDEISPGVLEYDILTEPSSSSTPAAIPKIKLNRKMEPDPEPRDVPQRECKGEGPQNKRRRRRGASLLASCSITKMGWTTDDDTPDKSKLTTKRKRQKKQNDKRVKDRPLKAKKMGGKAPPKPKYIRRMLTCDTCSYRNKITFRFERHLRIHEAELSCSSPHQSAPYRCDQCSKSFFCQQLFTFHGEGHQGLWNIECDACKARVPYPEIEAHVRTHTPKIFSCVNCSFCCTNREKFLFHLGNHGTGRWECDLCSKPYRSKLRLSKHLYHDHKLGKKYLCDGENCGREFYCLAQLKIHRKVHTDPHECPQCGRGYPSRSSLNLHLRLHAGETPYQCSECPASFRNTYSLKSHGILAHGAAKFKCEYCEKEYMTGKSLQSHLTTHEGTGIPCGLCERVLGDKGLWRKHRNSHKTELAFICEECGKGFTTREGLRLHRSIHGGEKRFKCQFCEKAFLCKQYLEDHERTHTGERPFTCKICGKGFTQRGSVTLHRRKAHPEVGVTRDSKEEVTLGEGEVKEDI